MYQINVTIRNDRNAFITTSLAGNDNENDVTTLIFQFPEELNSFNKYIEFQLEDKKAFDLIQNNEYTLKADLLNVGNLPTQIVLKDNTEVIFKSNIFNLQIGNSINASEEFIPEEHTDILNTMQSSINDLDIRVTIIEEGGSGGGIPEAPIDNNTYGRKNADWSPIGGAGAETDPIYTMDKPSIAFKTDLIGLATETFVNNLVGEIVLLMGEL